MSKQRPHCLLKTCKFTTAGVDLKYSLICNVADVFSYFSLNEKQKKSKGAISLVHSQPSFKSRESAFALVMSSSSI